MLQEVVNGDESIEIKNVKDSIDNVTGSIKRKF